MGRLLENEGEGGNLLTAADYLPILDVSTTLGGVGVLGSVLCAPSNSRVGRRSLISGGRAGELMLTHGKVQTIFGRQLPKTAWPPN